MMSGIVKEILALNEEFFEMLKEESDLDFEEYCAEIYEIHQSRDTVTQRLRDRIEAFVDFLYRDYPDIFKKFLDEASYAADEDGEFFPPDYLTLDDYEDVENYILAALSYDYKYKGKVFIEIFEKNFFENHENDLTF